MARLLTALSMFSLAMIVGVLASVFAALVLLGLSLSDAPLRRIGQFLGVSDAPAALLIAAGCVFVVVLYRTSLLISDLKDSNIALAQRVAILEYRLESLDEKVKEAAG